MSERLLTLSGPARSGEVLWDDEAGTFTGTDADLLNELAQAPQDHIAWPPTSELPATNVRALIVLLHCLEWDVPPELAKEARAWRRETNPVPRDAIA